MADLKTSYEILFGKHNETKRLLTEQLSNVFADDNVLNLMADDNHFEMRIISEAMQLALKQKEEGKIKKLSEAGRRGGQHRKKCEAIIAALSNYLNEKPSRLKKSSEDIACAFTRKYRYERNAIKIHNAGKWYTVFSDSDYVYQMEGDGSKDRCIKLQTFRRYVGKEKKSLLLKNKSNNPS